MKLDVLDLLIENANESENVHDLSQGRTSPAVVGPAVEVQTEHPRMKRWSLVGTGSAEGSDDWAVSA